MQQDLWVLLKGMVKVMQLLSSATRIIWWLFALLHTLQITKPRVGAYGHEYETRTALYVRRCSSTCACVFKFVHVRGYVCKHAYGHMWMCARMCTTCYVHRPDANHYFYKWLHSSNYGWCAVNCDWKLHKPLQLACNPLLLKCGGYAVQCYIWSQTIINDCWSCAIVCG